MLTVIILAELTSEQRVMVLHKQQKGTGYKKSFEAANFGVSTVRGTMKRFLEQGDFKSRNHAPGINEF